MSWLANRRRGVGKSLPYDAEVKYLQDDGKSRIRIPLKFNDTWSWAVDFMRLHDDTTYTSIISSSPYKVAFFSRYLNIVWTNGNEHVINTTVPRNVRAQVSANRTQINFSWGTSYTIAAPSEYETNTIILFHTSNTTFVQHRLYGFQVKDSNNNLILDLIPVRKGNVGYMYDKVSGQLFGNAGTGSFILGPDV